MWQKIKCWLGWHEWASWCCISYNGDTNYCDQACNKCPNEAKYCKHCGKVKNDRTRRSMRGKRSS